MSPRPVIFISAVSKELKSARQLVANTLTFLGYEPEWQEVFGTEQGDLRGMLRRRIDASHGVVQLVGHAYGEEPPNVDESFGRCSYTQFEALYAKQRGKKVWYLFIDRQFPVDAYEPELPACETLQREYRTRISGAGELRQHHTDPKDLENSILRLRQDLVALRHGVRRWAVAVILLLCLCLFGILWSLKSSNDHAVRLSQEHEQNEQIRKALLSFTRTRLDIPVSVSVSGNKVVLLNPDERTYSVLGEQLGIPPDVLRNKLRGAADEQRKAIDIPLFERANSAYIAGEYLEAESLALRWVEQARAQLPADLEALADGYILAATAAQSVKDYAKAGAYLGSAASAISKDTHLALWARVQSWVAANQMNTDFFGAAKTAKEAWVVCREKGIDKGPAGVSLHYLWAIGEVTSDMFIHLGAFMDKSSAEMDKDKSRIEKAGKAFASSQQKLRSDEGEFRTLIEETATCFGRTSEWAITSRQFLIQILDLQGRYSDMESESRTLIHLLAEAHGAESPGAIAARIDLANSLDSQGNSIEAEAALKGIIVAKESRGEGNAPEVLKVRKLLAEKYRKQERYAEEEQQIRKAMTSIMQTGGADSDAMNSFRQSLAHCLSSLKRYSEAEVEYRIAIKYVEKSLGKDHFLANGLRINLRSALWAQGKYRELENEYRDDWNTALRTPGLSREKILDHALQVASMLLRQQKWDEALAIVKPLEIELRASKGELAERAERIRKDAESGKAKAARN